MIEALALQALLVKDKAYAPYSGFCVGAALLSAQNHIYAGCNVECQTYSETSHAEEAARSAMIAAEGPEGRIKAIAVTAMPCGRCRQIILEHACSAQLPIFVIQEEGIAAYTLNELLPHAFILEKKT